MSMFRGTHHLGITVVDLERSAGFWAAMLGTEPSPPEHLDGPGVGRLVGYPDVRINRRWVRLPGGLDLELLQYLGRDEPAYDPGTAHPGNVHICLVVEDLAAAHEHCMDCGAAAVGQGWIVVAAGPVAGARIAYLRDPDGVTIELFEPAPKAGSTS